MRSFNKNNNKLTHQITPLKQTRSKICKSLTGCILLTAATMSAHTAPTPCPWIFTGSLGYTQFQDMFRNEGQTALGRIAIGKEFFMSDELAFGSELSIGVEIGLQTGNTMQLDVPQATLDILGGLPIQSSVKPILDVLATLRTNTLENAPIFMQFKAGAAYRQWHFENRDSVASLSKASPELQIGLGYLINDMAFITLSYQGIFGGNPDFLVNATNYTGYVSKIPGQNGVLLGLSLTV